MTNAKLTTGRRWAALVVAASCGVAGPVMAGPRPGTDKGTAALAFDPFAKAEAASATESAALVYTTGSASLQAPSLAAVAEASPEGPAAGTTLSVADTTVMEGAAGFTAMAFTVTMSKVSPVPVTVNYATTSGSATMGEDFEPETGTLTFPAGAKTQNFSVRVKGDTKKESNETFSVTLSNPGPSPVTIADGTATGTITDDDTNPPKGPKLTVAYNGSASVSEGNSGTKTVSFKVSISEKPTKYTQFKFTTQEGTAIAYGSARDYVPFTVTDAFVANTSTLTKTYSVSIVGDKVKEPTEYFDVELQNVTNAAIATGSVRMTITNDDN